MTRFRVLLGCPKLSFELLLTIDVDIDFGKFHELFKAASTDHAIKRGGNKKPVSEEAKIQSQRELVTLSALYTSSQSIPFSPQEPDANNDGSQESDKQPVIIPLPDNIKVNYTLAFHKCYASNNHVLSFFTAPY